MNSVRHDGMSIPDKYKCRVCGLSQYPDLPWGDSGDEPSNNICSCCGVEFGYSDETKYQCLYVRKHWIEMENCEWLMKSDRPDNWNMPDQLRSIPKEFLDSNDEALIRIYCERNDFPYSL